MTKTPSGLWSSWAVPFDGRYENVKEVNDALVKFNKQNGYEVPIHVDAASGGFIAPFLQPEIEWDFRLPLVKSINTSGHKYGLVYPGVGWIIWRDKAELPEDLIFHCNYLGGDLPNFALNFSRPGNQVIAQYYNFLRLGHEGYFQIQKTCQDVALYLSDNIAKLGPFELLSDGSDIPVFAFAIGGAANGSANFSAFDLSDKLRERGWLVPAYTFPKNRTDLAALQDRCQRRLQSRHGGHADCRSPHRTCLLQVTTCPYSAGRWCRLPSLTGFHH